MKCPTIDRYKMAISLHESDFIRGVGAQGLYWEVSDNLTELHLLGDIPMGRIFVGAYVLRDTNKAWKNYTNTVATYARWEQASERHSGAELRQVNGTMGVWSIVHPVGDLYIVYA
jgi:hypothetical protein